MIQFNQLKAPFPKDDVSWRVSHAGTGSRGVWCKVFAYITNRAIQQRLDDVCGPDNWRNEPPKMIDVNGKTAFACGLSIFDGSQWITKWDVADPTGIEPAKGGWSGAMKRAGAQWGIGRYLYHLDEAYVEVSDRDPGSKDWNKAKLSPKEGGAVYYWKTPQLPAWALPREEESEISLDELTELKRKWKEKFAPDIQNRFDLTDGFSRFVTSVVGEFPSADHTTWTRDALVKCQTRIKETVDPNGVSADVPFEE